MDAAKLQTIQIPDSRRQRSQGAFRYIILAVIVATAIALYFARPWASDARIGTGKAATPEKKSAPPAAIAPASEKPAKAGDALLTVSGYIINRERIEISPRSMNEVKWIGVKKGDRVKKGEIVVRLDDSEQQARILEIEGQLAIARVAVERAKLNFDRVKMLRASQIESAERADEARLGVASAQAQVQQLEGTRAMAQVWLEWTVIRSPIDGVVLEKLSHPGELVTPQTFGGTGTHGPSSALLSLADPEDLQVEVDISEADLPKVSMDQRCRVSPEAWPEKVYTGIVAEVAPEASRQKGTLQVKVKIEKPDRFLTPELSAKVEFLKNGG
ncbi:MAG: efflux RND transporter periplasmic adaptor subunit [Chthoniobacteraceae bacterium]